MYAWHEFHRLTGTSTEAELLGELWTGQTILFQSTLDSLDGVQSFNGRTGELPGEAALYFRCNCRRVLLRSEGAFGVSIAVITPRGPGILSLRYA